MANPGGGGHRAFHEQPKSHVRFLYADFRSAFNKMQVVIERRASHFLLPDQILLLLLTFFNRIWTHVLRYHFKCRLSSGLHHLPPAFYYTYRQLQDFSRRQLSLFGSLKTPRCCLFFTAASLTMAVLCFHRQRVQ